MQNSEAAKMGEGRGRIEGEGKVEPISSRLERNCNFFNITFVRFCSFISCRATG